MCFIAKHNYQDDGVIVSDVFAMDEKNLLILRAKIMAIMIDELPTKKSKSAKSTDRLDVLNFVIAYFSISLLTEYPSAIAWVYPFWNT
jgi:hypothetical protein